MVHVTDGYIGLNEGQAYNLLTTTPLRIWLQALRQ